MLEAINIKKQLIKARNNSLKEQDVLAWVKTVFEELDSERNHIKNSLKNANESLSNTFNINAIDPQSVFHINEIKKICVNYRLRFLSTSLFKGDYPEEALSEIRHLEKVHNTQLKGFKIMAPSRLFKLKETDDPLLFAPLGNGYYYLIHQWGNDLHPLRKLKFWPVKNIENMCISVFLLSLLCTLLTQSIFFREHVSVVYGIMLFMFYLKGLISCVLFLGIASGKNFSEYSWKSPYNKIS